MPQAINNNSHVLTTNNKIPKDDRVENYIVLKLNLMGIPVSLCYFQFAPQIVKMPQGIYNNSHVLTTSNKIQKDDRAVIYIVYD